VGFQALSLLIWGAVAFTWVKWWRLGHAHWVRRELYRLSLIVLFAVLFSGSLLELLASPAAKAKLDQFVCTPYLITGPIIGPITGPITRVRRKKVCP